MRNLSYWILGVIAVLVITAVILGGLNDSTPHPPALPDPSISVHPQHSTSSPDKQISGQGKRVASELPDRPVGRSPVENDEDISEQDSLVNIGADLDADNFYSEDDLFSEPVNIGPDINADDYSAEHQPAAQAVNLGDDVDADGEFPATPDYPLEAVNIGADIGVDDAVQEEMSQQDAINLGDDISVESYIE